MPSEQPTRRDFIKKAVYQAPAILTLPAVLSIASAGSPEPPGGASRRGGDGCEWWEFWCWIPDLFT